MIPTNSVTTSLAEYYTSFKSYCSNRAFHARTSCFAQAYEGMGWAIEVVTDTIVPAITAKIPQEVSDFVKTHFTKAPSAFLMGSLYAPSWLLNVGLSTTTTNLNRDHNFRKTPLVRDTAIGMLALHTLKAGSNAWTFLRTASLPAAVGFAFDIASIVALSQIIENKEDPKPAPQKLDKRD